MRIQRTRRNKSFAAKYLRFIPAAAVMIAIFVLSSRTGNELDNWLPWAQKWLPFLTDFNPMHYVAYFGLALALAFGFGWRSATWQGCLLNIAICVVYGITDEWHQSYVPMRSPDVNDLLHDAIGAAVAAVIVFIVCKWAGTSRSRIYTT
jgi:hypothetical protein